MRLRCTYDNDDNNFWSDDDESLRSSGGLEVLRIMLRSRVLYLPELSSFVFSILNQNKTRF